MIDIKKLTNNFKETVDNLKKRDSNVSESFLKELVHIYETKNEILSKIEENQYELNKISKENNILYKDVEKNKNKIELIKSKVENLKSENKKLSLKDKKYSNELEEALLRIPNLLDKDVPLGNGEEDNLEVFVEGNIPKFNFKVKNHVELGEKLGMLDFSRGTNLTGPRFVVYSGLLAKLERALINYFLDKLEEKGFKEHIVPYMVNEETMQGTGQLPKFKEDLFKIEDKDWYLIPTAEVPLTNLKKKEMIPTSELPLKYCAVTPCFRSEAGSYGKDTKGLIRLHQFQKVEMVVLCTEDESKKNHEEMVNISEEMLKELNLPFRKLLLCSGDIGFSANKCYDLEVWIPSQNKYREISSISNCGDFQARRSKIRCKDENKNKKLVHTLNGSALAVGRTVVAIMENYQNEEGNIKVPDVLVPYLKKKIISNK